MRLGICVPFDKIDEAAAYGYDYIEPSLGSIATLSEEEFEAVKAAAKTKPIKVEAANVMLPGWAHILGKETNWPEIREYLTKAYRRLAELGGETIVFGSGGARRVPDDLTNEEVWPQLICFSRWIAELARENGLTIALEPLNTKECNIITSVSEGGRLVEDVKDPNFKLLADYYHMIRENEGFGGIETYGKELRHTHFHPAIGSETAPNPEDGCDYGMFFSKLKESGYDGRVSLEGTPNFGPAYKDACTWLKSLMPN